MDRRRFLVLAVTALLAGCGRGSDATTTERSTDRPTVGPDPSPAPTATEPSQSEPAATQRAEPSATPTPTPSPTPTRTATSATGTGTATPASPAPVSFSGRGNAVTEAFDLVGGLTVVEALYRGSGDFSVTATPADSGDRRPRRLVDASGPYSGATADLLDAGTYALDVVAEKTYWELTVRQPRPASGQSLPAYLDRTGPGVFGPFAFEDDTATAAASYFGEGTLLVEAMGPTDDFPTVVFDRTGGFAGETTFQPPEVGFVDVTVDGDWTLGLRNE